VTKKTTPDRRTDKALWSTAYHEAGHAVAGWRLGIGLRKKGVTIVPDEAAGTAGSCTSRWASNRTIEWDASDKKRIRVENDVQSLLAGMIAQRRYAPRRRWRRGAFGDSRVIDDLLTRFTYDQKEIDAWVKLLRIRTQNLLSNPDVWRAVERLAAALIERRTIPGPEATEIMREGFYERLYSLHPEMREGQRGVDGKAESIQAQTPKRRGYHRDGHRRQCVTY
jgi:hypothetical protein